MDYLKKATELYKRQPSNAHAKYLCRANIAFKNNEHLRDNMATDIDADYNALPQRPWYKFWQR